MFVDEAYAEFAGATFIPELAVASRTSSSAGRSRRRSASPGCASACLVGAPDALDPIRLGDAGLQREHRRRRRRAGRARRSRRTCDDYLRQVDESKALLYAACDRLGLTYWTSDANFVLVARRRARSATLVEGAAARGIYLRDRSTEPGCAGCLRIAHRHRRAHAAVHRGDGRGAVRRAVIDRRTTETQIALSIALDGKGRYQVRTGIRFLDHMLELVRAPRRVRPARSRRPAISTSISITRSRISASRSARRSRRRSATGAASTAPATS